MYDAASLPVRVVFSTFQFLGLICTAWRIYFRLRINRFWWEDAWAAVALLSCLASLVGEWIYSLTHYLTSSIGFWFYTLGFTSVVRATHLSILFSIIRIIPGTQLARLAYFCVVCSGIFWAIVISAKIWQCASDQSWHYHRNTACLVKSQVLIFEFTSDCVTVAVLIILPLCMLWKVKLPTRQRRMILCIFASSVFLAFAAIFHVVGHVLNITLLMVAGIDSEIAASIIVCNLLVVVTYGYRLLWHVNNGSLNAASTSEVDSDDFTQRVGHPTRSTVTEINSSILVTQQFTTHISVQDHSAFTDSV